MDKLNEAKKFCEEKHKDAIYIINGKKLPYYSHCFEVADIIYYNVKEDIDFDYALTLAYLHDILEDTDVTYETMQEKFGSEIANGVLALTKDKKLPINLQLKDSIERILKQRKEVSIVKMADRICNIYEPFEIWSLEKQASYIEDAKLILSELKDASPSLAKFFKTKIDEYEKKIEKGANMKYITLNNKLYAYDKDTGMTIEFNNGSWDLTNTDYANLANNSNATEISAQRANEITDGKSAAAFISEYLLTLSNGE